MADFFLSISSNAVYDLLKNTIISGNEHAIRLCHYKTYQRNVKILTERLDILEKHQKEVITMVESAKQMDKDVYPKVLEWIEETQIALSSYREMVKSSSQNFSHFVVHPQSMIEVDSLSKSINKLIKDRIEFGDFIAYYSPFYDKDYMSFQTRERALKEVMKALKKPDVKMIGLHGMGGIGKTTLAKEIARQAKKEANLFDKVIMGSAISQTPNFANIQIEIGKDLGVEFDNNETTLTRARKLLKELGKKEKVLIILDDIWEEINLLDVGIDFSDNQKGSKILFTSRHQGLYSHAVEFGVHSLDEDESTKLFRKVVGNIVDEHLDCSRELIKECGGVPIIINTVAAALKDAPQSKWNTFLIELRNSDTENITGMKSKVFRSIQLSYDNLQIEGAKSLLLLCSIFPEDRLISDDDLLMYSVGWPSFQNVNTLEAARDKLYTLIDILRKQCLLLPSDESESHIRYHWVKLHDVIRDVVKSVASEKNWFPLSKHAKNGELPKGDLKDVNATSLLNDFTEKLPDKLACPNLLSFIDECPNLLSFIDKFDNNKCLSDCFFAETKMLKVLKLSRVDLRSPPSSFSCLLESLETLCLNNCDLEDTSFLGGVKELKCLDLSRSRFNTLSKQVGQLTHLQLLNLNHCRDLKVIEPDVISSLIHLEELYMRDVEIAWEVEKVSSERSNVSLAELKNLPRLNTLYLEIQNDTCLSKDFISRNMKRYRITVGVPDLAFRYNFESYSRVLMWELHNTNLIKECGFDKLMKECQALLLGKCDDVTIDIYVSNADGFPNLEIFELHDASNVRYLIKCNHPVFQNLKKLELTRLSHLQKMYAGELVAGTFSKLKEVKVSECHTLKSLFPISNIVEQLEEMKVESCDMMENIVFDRRAHQKIEFLKLQKLVLKRLPKFIQFCKVEREQNLATSSSLDSSPSTSIFPFFMEEVVAFPMLEKLKLFSLGSVEMIWADELEEVSYMQNLKDLTVSHCDKLKYLFSSAVTRSFIQLRKLKVSNCDNMQEILVTKEGGDEEGSSEETILYPTLEHIELSYLSNIKSFSGKYLTMECPSLKILNIHDCPKLKTFHKSCINEIEEAEEPLFDEKVVTFPILEQLRLSSLDCVEMIWQDQVQELSYMQNLKDLHVEKCHKLKYLFSSIVARSLAQLKTLKVEECENMQEIIVIKEAGNEEGSSMETICFPKLEEVNLSFLSNVKTFSGGKRLAIKCPSLKRLKIKKCPKLKTFQKSCSNEIEAAEEPLFNEKVVSFPMLEKLELWKLDSVEMIWADQLQEVSYMQNLKDLNVFGCHKLKYLFSYAVARSFIQLTKLTVWGCENMEEIVVIKEGGEEEGSSNDTISFPKLQYIKLFLLENLKRFSGGKHSQMEGEGLMKRSCRNEFEEAKLQPFFNQKVVSFPILEELELWGLDSVEMIWADQLQEVSYMQNLKDLNVFGCHKLKYLFSSAVARSFIQLRNLRVSGCENMEEIVVIKEGGEEEGSSNDTISFPKLERIRLSGGNLKRFSGGKHSQMECEGLMKRSCRNEFEEAKLQPFFNQKVSFPMLEKLELSSLDSVEMIWADELEEVSYMQNLKDLNVDYCGKLKYVFPCAMERRLVQLRNLKISGCWNMEGILVIKEGGSVMEELHLINHHHHPMALETLNIHRCPKVKMMKSWRSREVVEGEDHTFTENKVVVPNLEEVSLKWMPSSMSFQNLKEIHISEHDGMINLMNSSTARSLIQLQKMTIEKCKEMRQVIVDEEEARENVMVFPKLETLILHRLTNLNSFNSGNSEIQFPNLEKVFVIECPHMENFSSGNAITSKLAKIITKLEDELFFNVMHAKGIEEVWKGDLKTTVRMIWEENSKQLNEQPMKSEDYDSCSTSSSE